MQTLKGTILNHYCPEKNSKQPSNYIFFQVICGHTLAEK